MQCKDIMAMIEGTYPKSAALGFDNVGLQAGRSEKEVRRIYLALDATDAVIEEAIAQEADMLITHHPLIFSPQDIPVNLFPLRTKEAPHTVLKQPVHTTGKN